MTLQLTGFHHLTAVTARAKGNRDFYTRALALRLVKKTVNQDDVSAYHLFYADGVASPGTDITFFDWPAARERRGSGAVSRTGFRVAGEDALRAWKSRFAADGVAAGEIVKRDGRATLDFEDGEGQRLALVVDPTGEAHPVEGADAPPAAEQIRGLGPIAMTVAELEPTKAFLEGALNMVHARTYECPDGTAHVFGFGDGGAQGELHVVADASLARARQGAGGVHHVAFRTPSPGTLTQWTDRLRSLRVPTSGEVERYYF
ncbi:MAG: VOC family protein, partial [Hyphomicrobiales bacterium]|nr:VOC family protein [Hyphomicrobiales bacterium]